MSSTSGSQSPSFGDVQSLYSNWAAHADKKGEKIALASLTKEEQGIVKAAINILKKTREYHYKR